MRTAFSMQNQLFAANAYHMRSQAFKELAFELHRRDHFREAPSRRTCLFVTDDPERWKAPLSVNEVPRHLYHVEILDGARVLRADASKLEGNNAHYDVFETLAREYWSGQQANGLWEHLVEGSVRILESAEWPGQD